MEVQNPLSSSQIYPYLHQFLLENGASLPAGLNSHELFAEVFTLCRRVATDPPHGENLASRYAEQLNQRLQSSRQTELILCLSWVVLSVHEHPTYNESTTAKALLPLIRHSTYYSKARQLAVTIRHRERHIHTDFLTTNLTYPFMKVEIEGNPGTGNSYTDIHDNHIENLNPNATTVITKHYHINGVSGSKLQVSSDEALETLAEQGEAGDLKPETSNVTPATRKKAKALVDTEVVREEILTFVSKVRPLLDDAWKADFQRIWDDILNMQEVKEKIYDPGKQKHTNFNQYLVGNILYFMFEDCGACSDDKEYNASEVCMKLIGTTEHQLRKELSKFPPEEIKNRLHDYFTKKFSL